MPTTDSNHPIQQEIVFAMGEESSKAEERVNYSSIKIYPTRHISGCFARRLNTIHVIKHHEPDIRRARVLEASVTSPRLH